MYSIRTRALTFENFFFVEEGDVEGEGEEEEDEDDEEEEEGGGWGEGDEGDLWEGVKGHQ